MFCISAHAAETPCASGVFSDALAANSGAISESDSESTVQEWVRQTFATKDTLERVLACPEIANTAPTQPIIFSPITYTFPGGRNITVNYETVPRLLQQRMALTTKQTTPASPKIGESNDGTIWTNTDPAWYGIMVVEHGSLSEFVGPDKNNTISLEYIRDNIDTLYPRGGTCTNRTALANDNYAINRAVAQTVNLDDDTNDYYVAGDRNLEWIGYTEIALDVILTVATMGGYTAVLGATKAARASRALRGLGSTIKTLSKTDDVVKYVRATQDAARLTKEIDALDKVADATKIADKTAELNRINDSIRTLESTDDVKKYRDATKTYSDLNKYRHSLRGMRIAHRGNVIARAARAARATKSAMTGNSLIKHARKLGRSSSFSNRVRDWLFDSTLRNAGTVAKVGAGTSLAYAIIKFGGDLYDFTETTTDEYTSGIDFAPLLLLSADDLSGSENVVNYGMWLMWMGDSTNPADDDAAYLQAMDFAAKFHQDLNEIQNGQSTPCNVDIFVVRPVLQNPGTDNSALYYLIMNDTPWTTN